VLIEAYTVLAVCAFINFAALEFVRGPDPAEDDEAGRRMQKVGRLADGGHSSDFSWGTTIVSCSAIAAMSFCIIYPFWTIWFMNKNFELIKSGDEEFEAKYGALWEGLRVDDNTTKSMFTYTFFFLFRRFGLGILTVVWRDTLFFQISGLIFCSIFSMIIVGQTAPLETRRDNNLEYFNEFMILSVMYTAICLTDFQPVEWIRVYTGSVMVIVDCIHIGVNLVLMFQTTINVSRLRFTRWRLWRKYAKVRGDRMLEFQKKNRHKTWVAETAKYRNKKQVNSKIHALQAIQEEGENEDIEYVPYEHGVAHRDHEIEDVSLQGEFSD